MGLSACGHECSRWILAACHRLKVYLTAPAVAGAQACYVAAITHPPGPACEAVRRALLLGAAGALVFVDDGTHFDFSFPAGPVLAMQLEKSGAAFERRFFIGVFENRVAADDFLGLGERSVGDANFSGGETHSGACLRAPQLAACDQHSAFPAFCAEFAHRLKESRRRRPCGSNASNEHHVTHKGVLLFVANSEKASVALKRPEALSTCTSNDAG